MEYVCYTYLSLALTAWIGTGELKVVAVAVTGVSGLKEM
jgi:hypothetical protein